MNFLVVVVNILALDLGTQTGWSMSQNGIITSGSKSFATNNLAGRGVRFMNFRNWLLDCFASSDIDFVAFEQVKRHIGTYAAHVYGGFLAQLTSVCEEKHIPYKGYGVKTIKKFITGSGNASKQDVINAVETKGYKPIDDNESDSIAILLLAQSESVKESRVMYIENKESSNDKNLNSIDVDDAQVKNRLGKDNDNKHEIFTGPFKYSQVTG